jgi:rRNA maturation RNase YbeY
MDTDSPDLDELGPYETFAQLLLHVAHEAEAELSVTFVTDEAIQSLNREYRQKDQPTDVLSFAMREGESIGRMEPLGDIVISVDTAKKQATAMGHSLEDEVRELLFHGFMHLLGEDHEQDYPGWLQAQTRLQEALRQAGCQTIPAGLRSEGPLND